MRDVNKPVEGKSSIRSMFGNAVVKKKETVKLDEDDILAGILDEINPNDTKMNGSASTSNETNGKSTKSNSVSANKMKEKTEMAMVKDYIASISKAVPRKPEVKSEISDDVSRF